MNREQSDEPRIVPLHEAAGAPNRRILIIDDNPRIHDDFRTILVREEEDDRYLADLEAELFGEPEPAPAAEITFELDSAYQGKEGLDKVKAATAADRPYAVAFVDVRMPPGWDGIETIRRLWEVDPKLQVVICTAYSDYSWEETAELLDLPERFLILKKPFDTVVVRQLAHSLTEKWAKNQEAEAEVEGLRQTVDTRSKDLERARSLLEREQAERGKVETLLKRAWELDEGPSEVGALQESFGDLEELLARYRSLLLDSSENQDPGVAEGNELDGLLRQLPNAVERTLGGLERVSDLVRALRDLDVYASREMGPSDLNQTVSQALQETFALWQPVAAVSSDFGDIPPIPAPADDVAVIIRELLRNAAEAIASSRGPDDHKGRIELRTALEGHEIVLEVCDTGPGVPADLREKVFETWFSTREGRDGKGLAVVKEVVDRHGAHVEVDEAPGGGARFTVRWVEA